MVVLVQSITRGTTPQIPDAYSEFSRQLCTEMLTKSPSQRPSAENILKRPGIQEIVQGFVSEAKSLEDQTKGVSSDATSSAGYKSGDLVEYYSNTHKSWVHAVISAVNEEGRVTIDVKPNTWITEEQQLEQLRRRGAGAVNAAPEPVTEQPANQACSTQELERMLGEASVSDSPSRPHQAANVDEAVLHEQPEAKPKAVGIGGYGGMAVSSVDEECDKLLEELGMDDSGDVPAHKVEDETPWPAVDEQPELATSLTAAELDLLNDSM